MARAHWKLGLRSAILVTNPIPATFSAKPEVVNTAIEQALVEAEKQGIHGQAVTPFLLKRVSELTGGESLKANLELLKNNARRAGQIALSL